MSHQLVKNKAEFDSTMEALEKAAPYSQEWLDILARLHELTDEFQAIVSHLIASMENSY